VLEGSMENIPELRANVFCAHAGDQLELHENQLPTVDAVHESRPRRLVYPGTGP
jgi:hypothetical protein